MICVVAEFRKQLAKLAKLQEKDSRLSDFAKDEQERMKLLINILEVAIQEKTTKDYVPANSISQVKRKCYAFLSSSIQEVSDEISAYCDSVLKFRQEMIPHTLKAIQYCKTVPDFPIDNSKHISEHVLKTLVASFDQPASGLAAYFASNSYQDIISKLKASGIFSVAHINFELNNLQKEIESSCVDFIFASKPPARQHFPAGNYTDCITLELQDRFNDLFKYGRGPRSARTMPTQKVTAPPRGIHSAPTTPISKESTFSAESSERQKIIVPLLDLSSAKLISRISLEATDDDSDGIVDTTTKTKKLEKCELEDGVTEKNKSQKYKKR